MSDLDDNQKGTPASDEVFQSRSRAEHLSSCLSLERCAWGDHQCPVMFWRLGERLCSILMEYAGERGAVEGAEAVLVRIIRERDSKLEQVAVSARAGASAFVDGMRGFFSSWEARRAARPVAAAESRLREEGCTCGHICPTWEERNSGAECVHAPACAAFVPGVVGDVADDG
jgi:hypothetical protein